MHLKKLKYKVEVFKRLKYSEVYLKYTSSNLKYIWSMLQVYLKYTSLLSSWWTESILETNKFKLFFSVATFRNQNISKSILEVYFIFRVQKYIWSIAQFQQDKTSKSLHNLWNNGLVVRVQVYLTKDSRFKTIRWLKNCLSFHPSEVNLMNIKDSWGLAG